MKAYDIVAAFEHRVADRFGAAHGIAVDCCTHAIFLSLKFWQARGVDAVWAGMPACTYVSVPFAAMHAGLTVKFHDDAWQRDGYYQLRPWGVYDCAIAWRTMPQINPYDLYCLSFHVKKHIPIGRGGMVITNDSVAAAWLRTARYDGREGVAYSNECIASVGWHMYMTPEQAARGMTLMDTWPDGVDIAPEEYSDLRGMPIFQQGKT